MGTKDCFARSVWIGCSFKYLRFTLDALGTHGAECCWKVVDGKRFVEVTRPLVNAIFSNLNIQGYCMRTSLCLF